MSTGIQTSTGHLSGSTTSPARSSSQYHQPSKLQAAVPHRPPYIISDSRGSDLHQRSPKYIGSCFCGSVEYELYEDPVDACYCHCTTCQRLHGAPYQWAAIVHKEDILFTRGTGQSSSNNSSLIFYSSSELRWTTGSNPPHKISCSQCNSPIADEGKNMMLVFPSLINFPPRNAESYEGKEGEKSEVVEPSLPVQKQSNGRFIPECFKATYHMFYGQRCADIHDGVDKYLGKKGEEPVYDNGMEK